jgi:ABC-type amino acid transport substrate-binding protein
VLLLIVIPVIALFSISAFALGRSVRKAILAMKQQSGMPFVPGAATFSDFVTITGFGLTIAGIVMGWYTVKLQNEKSAIEMKLKTLADDNSNTAQQLQRMRANTSQDFAHDVDLHLESPVRGTELLQSTMPELYWRYTKHSQGVDYIVEVVKLVHRTSSWKMVKVASSCQFSDYPICRFHATNPNGQFSYIPGPSGAPMELTEDTQGEYLWRVIPITSSSKDGDIELTRISDWSEFTRFSVYWDGNERNVIGSPHRTDNTPANKANVNYRIWKTKTVLVGTTYSDNVHFSTMFNGQPRGHDIDIAKLLIEGCIRATGPSSILFDPDRCKDAAESYHSVSTELQDAKDRSNPYHFGSTESQDAKDGSKSTLHMQIIPYQNVDLGLRALERREIDMFIGSLTRAIERQNDRVTFTDGYYSFKTKLYVPSYQYEETLSDWIMTPHTVGVIGNSTNHWLASAMAADPALSGRVSVVAFQSFGDLKMAFERREIGSVVIDSVLGDELEGARALDLDDTQAWKSFHDRLGTNKEEFAIAVARDSAVMRPSALQKMLSAVWRVLDPAYGLDDRNDESFYKALQEALRSTSVQDEFFDLRKSNHVPLGELAIDDSVGPKETQCMNQVNAGTAVECRP